MAAASAFYLTQSRVSALADAAVAVTLSAPTSVSASDNDYVNKVVIHWDTIRDATLYRVFRNTANNSGTATAVGTTAANYFVDPSGTTSQVYFYWVRAENGPDLSPMSLPDQGVKANGVITPGPFMPLEPPNEPTGNPVTAAKTYLGKALFWDEQLSSTKTVACGTCHRPAAGGSDPRTAFGDSRSRNPGFDGTFNTADDVFGSPGVPQNSANGNYSANSLFGMKEQVTGRKSPSYLNAGYTRGGLFWDGRATDQFRDQLTNNVLLTEWGALESQSAGPPVSSAEMAHGGRNWTQVAARVQASRPLALASNIPAGLKTWIGNRTYPELFQEAFGSPDVTPARISMAIGTHERTLFSDRTPIDRWAAQIEPLTAQEESGRQLFENLNCSACHAGALFSDNAFHNIGVRPQVEDRGRFAVTGDPDDDGRFKTPVLRNGELHGPFMHNGRFPTLESVIEFYNRGGDFDATNINHEFIRPLNLIPQEKADLLAFLKRPLTDLRVKNELPPFDRPQLYTESTRVPQFSSYGRAGVATDIPEPIAVEPALLGNPNFTLAVKTSLRSGTAILVIDDADPGPRTSIPASASFARMEVPIVDSGAGYGYASINIALPNDAASVGKTFWGRWYIKDPRKRGRAAVTKCFYYTIFRGATDPLSIAPYDFDGDGKTDLSVFRATEGKWSIRNSANSAITESNFGQAGDRLVAADYDGDRRTDIAVYRQGNWFMKQSSQGFVSQQFGLPGDIPQPADYDGDGRADLAVFRPSTGVWYINQSSHGFTAMAFGLSTDVPIAADYDGDGRADLAVFRSGVWYVNSTTGGMNVVQFGLTTDIPVTADFDGDGKKDIAVWRPSSGTWFYIRSSDGAFNSVKFGVTSDVPTPGDFDGDGRTDPAVFRNGTWHYRESSTSEDRSFNWGMASDVAVPAPAK